MTPRKLGKHRMFKVSNTSYKERRVCFPWVEKQTAKESERGGEERTPLPELTDNADLSSSEP